MSTPLTDFSQFLTLQDLSKILRVSISSIWRVRTTDATFPRAFRPTPQTLLFDKAEIQAWLDESRRS